MMKLSFRHFSIAAATVLSLLLCNCSENVDTSDRYVYKFDLALSYLEKHPAYSQYVELIKQTPSSLVSQSTVAQLIGARGHFTVFAPTNEAIDTFLIELCQREPDLLTEPSWDAFVSTEKRDSIRRLLVLNSIIDSGDMDECFMTWDFPTTDKAEFPISNMNDRKLSVSLGGLDTILINGHSPVSLTQRNIRVTNGVVHQVLRVVAPSDINAATYLRDLIDKQKEGFLVMAKAIEACGLMDTLSKVRDEVYEELYLRKLIPDHYHLYIDGHNATWDNWTPRHRLYGFTIFAETDDFWRSQGLDPKAPHSQLLPQLVQWIEQNHQYSESDQFTTAGTDYDSPSHLLYQWVTYHILPFRASADRLVFHMNELGYDLHSPYKLSIPMYEIYPTMGKRRLLKIYESKESDGIYLNRFPELDNGRHGTYHETSCDPGKVGCRVDRESDQAILNEIVNCCIYPIDAPLAYTDPVRDDLGRQRLRFDGMTMMPEAMSTEIRLKRSTSWENQDVYIPCTSIYNYFENMQMNDETVFIYLNAYNYGWCNLHSDEMKAKGRFELTFKLPPVPRRNTYELRYKVLPNGDRGVQQFYFGSDPNHLPAAGIPVDLTKKIGEMNVGYEADTNDDDYNAEVDKQLRNNRVMKGARSVRGSSDSDIERDRNTNLRYIISRQTMDPDKTYYLRIKSVLDSDQKEFYMDYLELCPKEVYDNPNTPEDIW